MSGFHSRPRRPMVVQTIRIFTVLVMVMATMVPETAMADKLLVKPNVYSSDAGAIQGYDPVAYFTEQRAVKGKRYLKRKYDDATWYFTSEEHRTLFKQDPEKFVPQYGGWGAFAMSKGRHATPDPGVWTVYEGKLYLHASESFQHVWRQDVSQHVRIADKHYYRFKVKNL